MKPETQSLLRGIVAILVAILTPIGLHYTPVDPGLAMTITAIIGGLTTFSTLFLRSPAEPPAAGQLELDSLIKETTKNERKPKP